MKRFNEIVNDIKQMNNPKKQLRAIKLVRLQIKQEQQKRIVK